MSEHDSLDIRFGWVAQRKRQGTFFDNWSASRETLRVEGVKFGETLTRNGDGNTEPRVTV